MPEFSCLKCRQVVEAAYQPQSCPRCYSPAADAYSRRQGSLDHMFDVEGVSRQEEATAVDEGEWAQNLKTMEIDEEDLKPARRDLRPLPPVATEELGDDDLGVPTGETAGLQPINTLEVDEADIDESRPVTVELSPEEARLASSARKAAPSGSSERPSGLEGEAAHDEDDEEEEQPTLPYLGPRHGVLPAAHSSSLTRDSSSASRRGVPPTQEQEPLPNASPRPKRPTHRTRRLPTSQTERLMESVEQDRRRRTLGRTFWIAATLGLSLAAYVWWVGRSVDPKHATPSSPHDPLAQLINQPKALAPPLAPRPPLVPTSAPTALALAPASAPAAPPQGFEPAAVASAPAAASSAPIAAPLAPAGRPGSAPQVATSTVLARRTTRRPPTAGRPAADPSRHGRDHRSPAVASRHKRPAVAPAKTAPRPVVVTATPVAPSSAERARAMGLYREGLRALIVGETSNARSRFQAALAANPQLAVAYRGLGLAQEKLGARQAAKASFRRYLQLSPNASDGAAIRARIAAL